MQQQSNGSNGHRNGGFIYYKYNNKRGLKVFVEIAQCLGDWFPVRSLDYSPDSLSGSIVLVRHQNQNGTDETMRFGIKVTPSSENTAPSPGTMPFLSILTGGKGAALAFNSMNELYDGFLGDRQRFVSAMSRRLVPFTVPDEEPPPADLAQRPATDHPRTQGLGKGA